jgi:hypothetical protein
MAFVLDDLLVAAAVVSAASTIASGVQAYQQAEETGKQSRYDAEFEAQQLKNEAEQEEMNRQAAIRAEGRQAADAQRRRIGRIVASGGGLGETAISALSGQAAIDEINMQNANLASSQYTKGLGLDAMNALITGRTNQKAAKAAGSAALFSSVGSAVGSLSSA